MVRIENGKITATSLPLFGNVRGRFVSRMASAPLKDLQADGWREPDIVVKPDFDPAYERLSGPSYSYDAGTDKLTATYTVIELPEAVMKKRIDELEDRLTPIAESKEEFVALKSLLVEKTILTQMESDDLVKPVEPVDPVEPIKK